MNRATQRLLPTEINNEFQGVETGALALLSVHPLDPLA